MAPSTDVILMRKLLVTMSCTFKCPEAKTMAFGGVATGNKKAIDEDIVAGRANNRGFNPRPSA